MCYHARVLQKAFSIGNSTAVTLPVSANIKPGTRLRVKKVSVNEITYEIVRNVESDKINDYVNRVSGGFPVHKDMTGGVLATKLKHLEEHPYENDPNISRY